MLAGGDAPDDILQAYPWLEREDIQACLIHAGRISGSSHRISVTW
jgi:uncharacterized protein (DUF433 family)